eukprot:TRINITY_DN1992_c0_g3_i1.p2 TRINITY_DN1992_c0_g3~~TRINITY_DN1992_c0_g3_i1.p2  ORF type:complete len:112 (+),score=27.04 TRINITY_DN1992_c0_g3_i1:307-642(+)
MNGKGTYRWPDGRVYIGEFANDLKDGYGVMTWAHGERYEGSWKDGKMHGKGKMVSANGAESYGIWENGVKVNDTIDACVITLLNNNSSLHTKFSYTGFWGCLLYTSDAADE